MNNTNFELQFQCEAIKDLASRYIAMAKPSDGDGENHITTEIFPSGIRKEFLTAEEFRAICSWKSRRPQKFQRQNDDDSVREISRLALSTNSERIRIQAWTLLAGVKWPTASVFLHFAFRHKDSSGGGYPVLDFRALEALGIDSPVSYTFEFWWKYVEFCRDLAAQNNVSMRLLDKALWQWSAEQDPRPKTKK